VGHDVPAYYAPPVQDVIDELSRLPGIGPKSAQRIAYHLLRVSKQEAARLADAITDLKDRVGFCRRCFNIAEGELCHICLDERRDGHVVCVVEEPKDVIAIERTGEFRGRYHVLQGAISPIDRIGPNELRIRELLTRLDDGEGITEVVLCTNSTLEGDATAAYLARVLKPLGLAVTRLPTGLPVGGDLEFADELTLGRALRARRDLEVD
jgi:recombination protein RecR